jgi:hypothetical protein
MKISIANRREIKIERLNLESSLWQVTQLSCHQLAHPIHL